MKTVKSAANKLPKGVRKEFLELWKSTSMMDLYEGDLRSYFSVINSEMKTRGRKLEELKEKILDAANLLLK